MGAVRASVHLQGLGKTITALALILRSKGSVPGPPEGAAVTATRDEDGNSAKFYTMPAHASMVSGDAA